MRISIAIATHNRADELLQTLRTVSQLVLEGGVDFEVVVVANCCSDRTNEVVAGSRTGQLRKRLRCVDEPEPGLSSARNRAVAESEYDVIAFIDDDVDVDRHWLVALRDAHESGDFAAVGGQARLVYPFDRPAWLSDATEGLLTKVELGPRRRIAGPDELYGLNLSVRRDWFRRVGGFRADLGRSGNCLLGGEETELLQRICTAGGKLLYEPAALVRHRVPMERLRRRWFISRCYWGGCGAARMVQEDGLSCLLIMKRSARLLAAGKRLIYNALRHGPRSSECFDAVAKFALRTGEVGGLCKRITAVCHVDGGLPTVKAAVQK